MPTFVHILSEILPVLYMIVLADYALLFFRGDPFADRTASRLLKGSVVVHVVYLGVRTAVHRLVPLTSPFEFLTSMAAAIALVYLFLEDRTRTKNTGMFIIAVAFLFQLLSSIFIAHAVPTEHALQDRLFGFHTGAAILGYAGMVIAAVYGGLYLMLYYNLKASRFGLVYRRLPSLEVLGKINFYASVVGFVFLTLAMILGIIWAPSVFGIGWNPHPAIIGVLIAWLVYGISIGARTLIGWGGKQTAYFTLSGFFVVSLIFIVLHDFS